MCILIYLAAEVPLRTVAWVEELPAFNVSPLAPDEERVRCQFRAQNVVCAGSYEGCGCGFQLEPNALASLDQEQLRKRRDSLLAFAEYLREELPRVGNLELFACWDGDQDMPPEHRRVLTPSSLEGETFAFLEKELSSFQLDAG